MANNYYLYRKLAYFINFANQLQTIDNNKWDFTLPNRSMHNKVARRIRIRKNEQDVFKTVFCKNLRLEFSVVILSRKKPIA